VKGEYLPMTNDETPLPEPLFFLYQQCAQSRNEAMARAYLSGAYTMAEIGDHFGVHYSLLTLTSPGMVYMSIVMSMVIK